jgi:hypothetical protein
MKTTFCFSVNNSSQMCGRFTVAWRGKNGYLGSTESLSAGSNHLMHIKSVGCA